MLRSAPLFFFCRTALLAAGSTPDGDGVDRAFGDLIPPLLLLSRPDLLFATIDTLKGSILIVGRR
jgi:hypothetical protein